MADPKQRSRFLRSTSVRLSFQFAALYTLVTAVVFLAAYRMSDFEVSDWVIEQLDSNAEVFHQIYETDGLAAVQAELARFETLNFEFHRIFVITDASGSKIYGNVQPIDCGEPCDFIRLGQIAFDPPREGEAEIEAAGYFLRTIDLGPNRMVLGTSSHFKSELLEALAIAFVLGLIVVGLVGTAAGVAVGRRTERRLSLISDTLKSVSSGNMQARVPPHGTNSDDLARVSTGINDTLGDLQRLVESQQQISADIAHDLKTPLQRLRQRLETIGAEGELAPDVASEVDSALSSVDDLIDTFNALLRISQIEAGSRRARFAPVDLAPILGRIDDAYGAVAEERNQTLTFAIDAGPHRIDGDKELLTQMIANTVENALRHCPGGATIAVSLVTEEGQVVFSVADNGPGIPQADRKKVFRRFYRVEKSRTTPGSGLGLSLVRAVADLHGASIELIDNDPGLRVAVRFSAKQDQN